jgi:hypothetical protein
VDGCRENTARAEVLTVLSTWSTIKMGQECILYIPQCYLSGRRARKRSEWVCSSQTPLKPSPSLQPHFHRFRVESNLRQPFSKQGTDLTLRGPSSPSSRRIIQTGHSTGANFPRVDTDWVQILQLNLASTRTFSPSRCHTSPPLLKMLQTSQSRQNVFGPTISTSIRPLIAYDRWLGI